MKKNSLLLVLSALILAGCNNNTNSSSDNIGFNSSTVVSSSSSQNVNSFSSTTSTSSTSNGSSSSSVVSSTTSTSSISNGSSSSSIASSITSSSSSSSSIDTTGWIENGDETYAINNPNKWIYSVDSSLKATLAMEYENELYFFYENNSSASWDSAQLFYHSNNLRVGNEYTLFLSFSSSHGGKITINGEAFEIKEGTTDIEIESLLLDGHAAISIQFGTEESGILSENLEVIISSFKISKKANARDIIQEAIDANNYTITLTEGMNGYGVTSKFFEEAAYFDWYNTIDGTSENIGYAENETGVFGFSIKNGKVSPNSKYLTDLATGEIVKGLYTSNYGFTYSGLNGLPSLHKLDLEEFDYNLVTGQKVRILDGSSIKALTFMLDDVYSTYYYGGIATTDILLTEEGNLELLIRTKMGDYSKFLISNIGTTTDDAIENFIASDEFCPSSEVSSTGDPEVEEMLNDINAGNYSINKSTGGEFYMNENYSYDISIDSETKENVITGYVKLNDGVYGYSVEDGEVILGENYTELMSTITEVKQLAGLNSGAVTYFSDASKYSKNETENWFEMTPTDNSHYTFGTKWFGMTALSCNTITLERGLSNITIGANMAFADGAGLVQDSSWNYLVVYEIGNTTVEFMDSYLASL